jgi:hypothetical protein
MKQHMNVPAQPKAVIFTHIGFPSREPNHKIKEFNGDLQNKLITDNIENFKKILLSKQIGLAYIYVDTGTQMLLESVEAYLDAKKDQRGVVFELEEMAFEQKTRDILKIAFEDALSELQQHVPGFNSAQAPNIQIIGLPHLLSLFQCLINYDPSLVRDLAGRRPTGSFPQFQFSYDSPKFIDAVIRLRRGNDAILGQSPIFRIDSDVEVNDDAIALLIQEAHTAVHRLNNYHFFSGGYGNASGIRDPLNDYAVRTHFLHDVVVSSTLTSKGEQFLRDLGAFGATQIPGYTRQSPQVISGAGLYMSRQAIRTLPPFMNLSNLTTWVDDHLKRRLHEAVGHLVGNPVEHITNARFTQHRDDKPEAWTKDYFARLLRGCLLHSLIVSPSSAIGPLSKKVEEIIRLNITNIPAAELKSLEKEFTEIVAATAYKVLAKWKMAGSLYDCPLLETWAKDLINNLNLTSGNAYQAIQGTMIQEIIDSTVTDALAYLRLLTRWGKYVDAIEHLDPAGAFWLFRKA